MTTLETPTRSLHERPLPAGWRMVTLGDVCGVPVVHRDPSRDPESRFCYIDISSIDTRTKQIVGARFLAGRDAPSRARQIVHSQDVLVATTRPNLNAVTLVPAELDPAIASTGFCVLRCGPAVHPQFVFYTVRSPLFVSALTDMTKGSTYPAVTDAQVRAQTIILPPLPEQKRIAATLREQMAAVEKARAAAQARLEAALALPAALAADTVHNGATQRHLLGDCLVEVRNGVGSDWSRYPVLGATRSGLAPAKEGVGKVPERYKLADPVTVFYNPMRILLGSIAMVDEGDATGITSPDYVVVKGQPGVLDTRWFYYWFRSAKGAHLIESLSRGAVRERILFNRLAAGEIEIPEYETQRRASIQMQQVRPIVDSITRELETVDALPATILRRMFFGAE